MRREPTDAEAAMWRLLRDRRLAQFKFRRQSPFQSFILDFVCFEKCLVIEIDGSQHAASERELAREAALTAEGFRTARYATMTFCSGPWRYLRTFSQSSPSCEIPLTRRLAA
jgi:very-short-patch-repair endonuclease